MFRLAVYLLGVFLVSSTAHAVTPARLSDKQIEKLLAKPTELANQGKQSEAQRTFEQIAGPASPPTLRRADLVSRFGLTLCAIGIMQGDELAAAGRGYLAEATAQYRGSVGESDPLVADALQIEFACLSEADQLSKGE